MGGPKQSLGGHGPPGPTGLGYLMPEYGAAERSRAQVRND